jgi:uncharacterized membrane protein
MAETDDPTSFAGSAAPEPAMDPSQLDPAPPAATPPAPAGPGFLDRLPWWTVPAILLGVPLLFAIAVQLKPSLYGDVVWKYYWGPIKADAENFASLSYHGIVAHSGYNVVNTLSWAVLLGVCILGLAQMLNHFRTPMDDKLIVAATAWVVVGSVAHVLEDTGLFRPALEYFFITPPIYLLFGAFGVTSFLIGQWMRRIADRNGLHAALRMLWIVHVFLVLGWLALWLKAWPQITHYVNPLWVAAFAAVNFLVARHFTLKAGRVDPSLLTLLLSLGTYLLVGAYVVTYILHPWTTPPGSGMWYAFLLAPVLAGAVTLVVRFAPAKAILGVLVPVGSLVLGLLAAVVVYRIAGKLGITALQGPVVFGVVLVAAAAYVAWRWWTSLKPVLPQTLAAVGVAYALAINLLLVFGQMLDAFATALGIDLAGYQEKHVLSAGVIDGTRSLGAAVHSAFIQHYPTFVGFATVKLLVSLLVIYAIDVQSNSDARRYPTLIGLVKFAIIMVGIGPGVRDFTRLSLGV